MRKFLRILLILFLIIIIALAYPVISYLLWQKKFESNTDGVTCLSNTTTESSLDAKFKDFVLSDKKITFVELTPSEVLFVLKNINVGDDGKIENICLKPENKNWSLYMKLSIQNASLPWIRLDIVKDDMETAQLYVKKIYIGDMEIPASVSDGIKMQINKGISDALTQANENNFIGRKIQNIELLKDKIVVKGIVEE